MCGPRCDQSSKVAGCPVSRVLAGFQVQYDLFSQGVFQGLGLRVFQSLRTWGRKASNQPQVSTCAGYHLRSCLHVSQLIFLMSSVDGLLARTAMASPTPTPPSPLLPALRLLCRGYYHLICTEPPHRCASVVSQCCFLHVVLGISDSCCG